jgi:hypothetical protein
VSRYEDLAEAISTLWAEELEEAAQKAHSIEERVEAARQEIARLTAEAEGAEQEAQMLKSELAGLPERLMQASLKKDRREAEKALRRRYSEIEGALEALQARAAASREELRERYGADPEAHVEALRREGYPLIDERVEMWERFAAEHDRLVRLLADRYAEVRGRSPARVAERSQRERRDYLAALRRS